MKFLKSLYVCAGLTFVGNSFMIGNHFCIKATPKIHFDPFLHLHKKTHAGVATNFFELWRRALVEARFHS